MRTNTTIVHHTGTAFYHPEHQVTSSTSDQNTQLQYFDVQPKIKTEYSKSEYDAVLQSPTLSSSTTHQNFIIRPATYLPDQDSLAVLLGSSIDDPLLRAHQFPVYPSIKQEPFEYSEPFIHSQLNDYSAFHPTGSYVNMLPISSAQLVATAQVTSTSNKGSDSGAGSSRSSPILPICPIPTEKTVDHFYNSTLSELSKGLPQETRLLQTINTLNRNIKPEPLRFALDVAEENLKDLVTWAKMDHFFSKLEMDDQMNLLQASWATIHLIDFTFAMVKGELPVAFGMCNGQEVPTAVLALIGHDSNVNRWNQVVHTLQSIGFTKYDYCAFRFLALFHEQGERMTKNQQLVSTVRHQVIQSWSEVRCTTTYFEVFEQIRNFAAACQEFLVERYTAGDLDQYSSTSLLCEMLRTHHATYNSSVYTR